MKYYLAFDLDKKEAADAADENVQFSYFHAIAL